MSAAENQIPAPQIPTSTPIMGPDEPERLRLEDPDFPLVLARAKARGRGETHDPKRHGPFEKPVSPNRRAPQEQKPEPTDGNLSDVIARFLDKGSKSRLVPNDSDSQPHSHLRRLK